MSRAATSIATFAVYLVVNGVGFLAVPNRVLPALGLPPAEEPWIRGLGIVITVMAFYHVVAARAELVPFFRATVFGRLFVLASLGTLWLLRLVPPHLLLFGIVDVSFAVWTAVALQADNRTLRVADST